MSLPRTARFTTPAAEEVHLRYAIPGGKDIGKPADVFYPATEYARRQQHYGPVLYPAPLPADSLRP